MLKISHFKFHFRMILTLIPGRSSTISIHLKCSKRYTQNFVNTPAFFEWKKKKKLIHWFTGNHDIVFISYKYFHHPTEKTTSTTTIQYNTVHASNNQWWRKRLNCFFFSSKLFYSCFCCFYCDIKSMAWNAFHLIIIHIHHSPIQTFCHVYTQNEIKIRIDEGWKWVFIVVWACACACAVHVSSCPVYIYFK